MEDDLMKIPAILSAMTGGSYMDGTVGMRNTGISPKQYDQTLAMRHRAKNHKAKRKGKRKK